LRKSKTIEHFCDSKKNRNALSAQCASFKGWPMTVSEMDQNGARAGSLLSLAPREDRHTTRPTLSPMLAALARAPEPATDMPAPALEEGEPVNEADTAGMTGMPDESVPVRNAAEPALPEASSPEDAPEEEPPARDVIPDRFQPETANGLVARLRRQFAERPAEGRSEDRQEQASGSPVEPAAPQPMAETRRSALEEVRFRLREFRAELVARSAR